MQSLRHIVVGTDFSPSATAAIECALVLAQSSLARITLVHVLDEESSGDIQLESEVARYRNRGIDIHGLVRTGKPWEKLNNVAVEVGASLIVIGRRNSIGTIAQHLLGLSSRPVLVVPEAV